MREEIKKIKEESLTLIQSGLTRDELQELKVKVMGKKGSLTALLKQLGSLSSEERPLVGQIINEVRASLEQAWDEKMKELEEQALLKRLEEEFLDITLPGIMMPRGHQHPLTKVIEEIEDIFIGMGFQIAEGPEIETDYYNFEALNLPKDHPARDMQDTFFITEEILLRTQTSPVQIRTMEKLCPGLPVKIIAPGKVFRNDDDATHSPMFHQVEGLLVDRGVRMSDLKGILLTFSRQMFGEDRQIRLRPSFFPFTEPSAEVDVSCMLCGGKGCKLCKGTGWIEILGAGMVHPKVLEAGGYDSVQVTGFAFGMGVERIAMLKYGIEDMRLLFDNDLRFLAQF
ncbi:phenylalanyl-tRNA synthetase, alpha subunit [Syntrophobotulus glycolicus DSM 8271]|uniref:Phenylalanine--tRNA ligase alpha subunit n=1 Tax=Syntrophobotulus glycolicus (strain DSM 8271 / FlGlyR) TaxID=645991 RepID=F0SWT1_SYNGF|nr:phenylalanine--tRNA ligase subunit alpha [Syntrophobotulus glycolicus]ADY54621.1 phenylalanyl-tRNA synthetase, alpha subunit [Syntrophobotulus glycolicus DSM 8271]